MCTYARDGRPYEDHSVDIMRLAGKGEITPAARCAELRA